MANNEIFDLNTRKGRKAYKKAQQAANALNNGGAVKASEVYGKPTLHESAEEIVDAVQSVVVPAKTALRSVLDAAVSPLLPDTGQVTAGVGAEEPSWDPETGDYVDFDAIDAEPTPDNYYVLSNGIEAKDVAAELSYNVGTAFTYMFRSSRVDGVIKGDPESDLNKAIDHLLFELDRRNFTRKGASA